VPACTSAALLGVTHDRRGVVRTVGLWGATKPATRVLLEPWRARSAIICGVEIVFTDSAIRRPPLVATDASTPGIDVARHSGRVAVTVLH